MSTHASTPQWVPMPSQLVTPASSVSMLPSPPDSASIPRTASASMSYPAPGPAPQRAVAPTAAPGPSHASGSSQISSPTIIHDPANFAPINGSNTNNSKRRSELSASIQGHTDAVMSLIAEQRELAIRSSHAEAENLVKQLNTANRELETAQIELRGAKAEVEERRRECQSLKTRLKETRAAAALLEKEYRRASGEVESVRRENEELKRRIAVERATAIAQGNANSNSNSDGMMPRTNASATAIGVPFTLEVNRNPSASAQQLKVESPRKGQQGMVGPAYTDVDASHLSQRCEELRRENARLRREEENLLQRAEIFEGPNAGLSAPSRSIEALPDLNDALETLRGHLSIKTSPSSPANSQDITNAKKRRLEEMNGR